MKTLKDTDFFKLIDKNKVFNIEIEDRLSLGYETYGLNNHAEFIDYHNPHDDCLWDAIIPGYNYLMKDKKVYKTKSIIGILWLSNGNHKIAIKIYKPGYTKQRAEKDIKTYIKNYLKKFTEENPDSHSKWIEVNGL